MNADELCQAIYADERSMNRDLRADTIFKMRGLVVGTLEKWLGKDQRRWLLEAIYPHSKGSTKNLTPAQLVALLDALKLDRGADGKYEESDASVDAREAMKLLLVKYQKEHGQTELAL